MGEEQRGVIDFLPATADFVRKPLKDKNNANTYTNLASRVSMMYFPPNRALVRFKDGSMCGDEDCNCGGPGRDICTSKFRAKLMVGSKGANDQTNHGNASAAI